MMVATEASDLCVADIGAAPEAQGPGIGGALRVAQREAGSAGLGMRALVDAGNGPSLGMFRQRGFFETGRTAGPSLELRWAPADGPIP